MKCEKCGVELNGKPYREYIDKYGYKNNKYGCLCNLCLKCYKEVNK